MTSPYIKLFISGVVILGGGWGLYCLSPAGAAERDFTRQQNEQRRQMLRKSASTEKSE